MAAPRCQARLPAESSPLESSSQDPFALSSQSRCVWQPGWATRPAKRATASSKCFAVLLRMPCLLWDELLGMACRNRAYSWEAPLLQHFSHNPRM